MNNELNNLKKKQAKKIQITINEFGEIVLSQNYDTINSNLDRSLYDKKMKVRVRNKN